jgi:hypothetical protein
MDPIIMITTILFCIGGILFASVGQASNSFQKHSLITVCGWTIFYNIMFVIFNFRKTYTQNQQNIEEREKHMYKKYDALHDYGGHNRNRNSGGMQPGLFFFSLFSVMAAFTTLLLGIYLITLAKNNNNNNNNNEFKEISDSIKRYYYITGGFIILSSIVALSRLRMDYLFASLGVLWFVSVWTSPHGY